MNRLHKGRERAPRGWQLGGGSKRYVTQPHLREHSGNSLSVSLALYGASIRASKLFPGMYGWMHKVYFITLVKLMIWPRRAPGRQIGHLSPSVVRFRDEVIFKRVYLSNW